MKNKPRFTPEQLANTSAGQLKENKEALSALFGNHIVEPNKKVKKSKFGNVKETTEDGTFDSKRELKEWKKLLVRLRAGEIYGLARQTKFELNAGGSHSVEYRADFTFFETSTNAFKVVDAKGARTKVYLKKKKLMKTVLNLDIIEV